jgi:hypothetical protein
VAGRIGRLVIRADLLGHGLNQRSSCRFGFLFGVTYCGGGIAPQEVDDGQSLL